MGWDAIDPDDTDDIDSNVIRETYVEARSKFSLIRETQEKSKRELAWKIAL